MILNGITQMVKKDKDSDIQNHVRQVKESFLYNWGAYTQIKQINRTGKMTTYDPEVADPLPKLENPPPPSHSI